MSRTGGDDAGRVRIDKWLWAARFFKTRALANEAVEGAHVRLGGERVKAARGLKVGDVLEIRRGEERLEVVVAVLSEQRRPASEAQTLYRETDGSVARRETEAADRAQRVASTPRPEGRPDKRARRKIVRFRDLGGS